MTDQPALTDWRGTPIRGGDTVIYGAGVGRSVALVEATVEREGDAPLELRPKLTPSGRVWLRIVRRAYGYTGDSSETRVHVGADRLTIVTALPPSELPRIDDKILDAAQSSIRWHEKAIAEVERDGPTSARDPRYTWTAEEEIAHHRSKLTAAQAKLRALTSVPSAAKE